MSASNSTIPVLGSYRNWISEQSRGVHAGLIVVALVLQVVVSLLAPMLQSSIGGPSTLIVGWLAFLAGLYTAYAIAR